ncbi:ABC transporter permease [Microbacterium sp. A196]|uniref:ABC transporter permease n=1 Tax=Microbacterium sp. A196 TaxID=3457320 RepID=UPI003FD67220
MISADISIPRIPVGDMFEGLFDWLNDNLGAAFDTISDLIGGILDGFIAVLTGPDALILALLFGLIALATRGWKFSILGFVGLLLIISMGQWDASMQTLALVLVAALVAILISVPLGILAARSRTASAIIRPILDFMQTMPGFVWLVPVVTLFGIGIVPGVVATIIFALPPGVRLTELGLRSVDSEVVEASEAFGATPRQTLFGVQLPLATPAIMAGVNQVIMMSLSMAVIAGLVGAGGLGGQVTSAIATLNIGLGFEAGLSVVILAIYLDRVTASFGAGTSLSKSKFWRRAIAKRETLASTEASDATATAAKFEKVGG